MIILISFKIINKEGKTLIRDIGMFGYAEQIRIWDTDPHTGEEIKAKDITKQPFKSFIDEIWKKCEV